jgi:hypothetical protein
LPLLGLQRAAGDRGVKDRHTCGDGRFIHPVRGAGEAVLISMKIVPGRAALSALLSPNITSASAASLVTQDRTTSTSAANPFGVESTFAPRCCKGRVCSRVWSYTVRS